MRPPLLGEGPGTASGPADSGCGAGSSPGCPVYPGGSRALAALRAESPATALAARALVTWSPAKRQNVDPPLHCSLSSYLSFIYLHPSGRPRVSSPGTGGFSSRRRGGDGLGVSARWAGSASASPAAGGSVPVQRSVWDSVAGVGRGKPWGALALPTL